MPCGLSSGCKTDMQVSLKKPVTANRSGIKSYLLNDLWEELLTKQGTCWAEVISDSMQPAVRRGSRVLVERTEPDKIRFGDIIVFKKNNLLIVHRVIGKYNLAEKRFFVEKGDASLISSLVHSGDIIGRVTAIQNDLGILNIIAGTTRIRQLALAAVSFTSLELYLILKSFLPRGRQTLHYGPVYTRFFHHLTRFLSR
jgi:signal peptidase I